VPMRNQGVRREFIRVEDDCWIASHAVVLAGVTVGRGSIVAAGSVVTKNVPPYSIVAGVPARVVGRRKGAPKTVLTRAKLRAKKGKR
jgi:acetyltransferase-like isoleucine patch superfamily enzyme